MYACTCTHVHTHIQLEKPRFSLGIDSCMWGEANNRYEYKAGRCGERRLLRVKSKDVFLREKETKRNGEMCWLIFQSSQMIVARKLKFAPRTYSEFIAPPDNHSPHTQSVWGEMVLLPPLPLPCIEDSWQKCHAVSPPISPTKASGPILPFLLSVVNSLHSGACVESVWVCRKALGFWLLTSPFWACWAPVACRKEPMYCWGTASRKVPVTTMAWQPSEHKPVAWLPTANLRGTPGQRESSASTENMSHVITCPPTQQLRCSSSSRQPSHSYYTSAHEMLQRICDYWRLSSVLIWCPLQLWLKALGRESLRLIFFHLPIWGPAHSAKHSQGL